MKKPFFDGDDEGILYSAFDLMELSELNGTPLLQEMEEYYRGKTPEPKYVRKVFLRAAFLKEYYQEYKEMIEIYEYVLKRWPMASDNPLLQRDIPTYYGTGPDEDNVYLNKPELGWIGTKTRR